MSNNRNDQLNTIAGVFKALSSPSRLQVLIRVVSAFNAAGNSREDELCACVGEIAQDMNISPSTVSHHLKELRNAGLIQMKRRGQKVECSVDFSTVQGLIDFFNGWFEQGGIRTSGECLDAVTDGGLAGRPHRGRSRGCNHNASEGDET
ncbi:MAG TPA: metalloregulator ArsR/SmtB family transcription factor [bacterium]|nr:metalloregulator ArsR/SmtB family transcription factor [bacterium]